MTTAGITSFTPPVQSSDKKIKPTGESAIIREFIDYMKKSPEERMLDSWLSLHGISKEEFRALSPEDQQRLIAKMKREIEEQTKERANFGKMLGFS